MTMRRIILLSITLLTSLFSQGQDYFSYEKPIEQKIYSKVLKDSVAIEITIPKNTSTKNANTYPVIYLLDKQLEVNYKYNLNTIDYLTTMNNIPKSIVVGITFNNKNRNSWTKPNKKGGQADDLIFFISNELQKFLKSKYSISSFNLLIGHSRTAIFSSYALSKEFDFFNGTIASSTAYFDFGDSYDKQIFENFMNSINSSSHKYYLYFSSGEKKYGDLHEKSVDLFNAYLNDKTFPSIFEWQHYKFKVEHSLTPGLTVSRSLSSIFKDYGNRVHNCIDIINNPDYANEVPWEQYEQVYTDISRDLGFTIKPTHIFFNSIASGYYNDYSNLFKKNNLNLSLEVLLKAMKVYPNDYEYSSWIAENYYELKDFKNGNYWINKSIEFVTIDVSLTTEEKNKLIIDINSLIPKK